MNHDLDYLAKELKSIFPKGKKDGCNLYWTEGLILIKNRIRRFFEIFGDEYSDEDIIDAAKRYVDSFQGSYIYMRTLKYFIFKCDKSTREPDNSDLINYLENKDEIDTSSNGFNRLFGI